MTDTVDDLGEIWICVAHTIVMSLRIYSGGSRVVNREKRAFVNLVSDFWNDIFIEKPFQKKGGLRAVNAFQTSLKAALYQNKVRG